MAFDDVQLIDAQCPPHGFCDFERSFCSWSNLGARVDQRGWLLGAGATPNPNTGPTVDHTTNSSDGNLMLCILLFENTKITHSLDYRYTNLAFL